MKKLTFNIKIKAPATKVFDRMLGISDKSYYEKWTAEFNPASTYEGNWNKGSRVLFVGIDEKGAKGGMVSEIAENIPDKFVSIRHLGILKGNQQITEGPEAEKWAGVLENYSFEESTGMTYVTVEVDTADDFIDYMNQAYTKALSRLKKICED